MYSELQTELLVLITPTTDDMHEDFMVGNVKNLSSGI